MLMHTTAINKEMEIIRLVAGDFSRHPLQVNGLLEADAEIIRWPGKNEEYLVLKTDGIHEEIKEKLYEDPYLIGWMAVTAPISDIAAVGAQPTGILLSVILPQEYDEKWLEQFKGGINEACSQYNIYVLGGDTNFGDHFSVSATVVAGIKSQRPLLRKGMKPGDHLYATAPLGLGNAYAYARFFDTSLKVNYQPVARLSESRLISKYATACMDSSDGLFPALALLADINEVGFNLDVPLQNLLEKQASMIYHNANLPAWMLMAGPHGEYELLFSVPREVGLDFEQAIKNEDWQPVYLGKITSGQQINFSSGAMQVQCSPATIPNLFYEANGNIQLYFELLMQQHKTWVQQ